VVLCLFVVQAAFNTIFGEEFLFRGVLLPRWKACSGAAAGWRTACSSVFNHVHQPWGIPNSVLTGLLYTYPAYRYRSTWMSIIIHSARACT
jgi:membrane protease YdiL (CAAX protease family)